MIDQINFYPTNAMNSWTGYGRLELGIAGALQRMGVQLNFAPNPNAPTLITGYAGWLQAPHVVNTRRYIVTQSESTQVSQKWVALLNWHAEAVFVTNEALPQIYRDSGVTRPVYCVGHGIELSAPMQSKPWDGESRFEWLTYSYGDMRKGAELAIMAFKRLFHQNPAHHLTVKARNGEESTWLSQLRDDQVSVIFGQQSEHEWMSLLARSHAFVFPSRAEGFGMPPREATLVGLPTIATEWLGMADVALWGLPIRVKDLRTASYWDAEEANAVGAKWAEPDLDHLQEQMSWVYANYDQARQIAEAGRWYIRERNNWDRVADNIMRYMDDE